MNFPGACLGSSSFLATYAFAVFPFSQKRRRFPEISQRSERSGQIILSHAPEIFRREAGRCLAFTQTSFLYEPQNNNILTKLPQK